MINWKHITTTNDVDAIFEKSDTKPQILFKDSTHCGISAHAKSKLEAGDALLASAADFNYLDLIRYRSISNYIADKLNVLHQSPQIIILKDRKVAYKASHHAIEPEKIAAAIAAA